VGRLAYGLNRTADGLLKKVNLPRLAGFVLRVKEGL